MIRAIAAVTAAAGSCTVCCAVPPNDLCGAATPISGSGMWPVDLVGANRDGALASCGRTSGSTLIPQNDVWYSYTAATTGIAIIRTTTCTNLSRGVGASILTGCGGVEQFCMQNICSATTPLALPIAAGTTYLLRLNSYTLTSTGTPQQGTATLNITEMAPPANDNCASGAVLTAGAATPIDFTGYAQEQTVSCGNNPTFPTNDMWFLYTASVNGSAQLGATGCTGLTLGVTATAFSTCGGSEIACAPDLCAGSLFFTVTAGTSYRIRLGNHTSTATGQPQSGSATVTLVESVPPSNDSCATATEIAGGGEYPFDNRATLIDGPLPPCANVAAEAAERDVWFALTMPFTGSVSLDAGGPTTQVVLSVYDACGGNVLACDPHASSSALPNPTQNRNWLSFSAAAGQRYLIRVARNASVAAGPGTLRVRTWFPNPGDSCETAPDLNLGTFDWFNDGVVDSGLRETFAFDGTPCSALPSAPRGGGHFWAKFTPTRTGAVLIDSFGSGYETQLTAYSGCTGPAIACSDDRTAPSPPVRMPPDWLQEAYLVVRATQGVPIYVRISTEYELGDYYKPFRLTVSEIDPLANEDCSSAAVVQPGSTPYNSDFALSDLSSTAAPCYSGVGSDRDLWYVWTPTQAGSALVHTCYAASYLDVVENLMMILQGSCTGPMIACSTERLDQTFPCPDALAGVSLPSVTPGTPYYIRLAARRESVGEGQLNIEFTPAPCPADFNGQNGATVQDIYDFLSDWNSQVAGGPVIVASADFNGQSGITVQDIYDFLAAWSTGCP